MNKELKEGSEIRENNKGISKETQSKTVDSYIHKSR